MSSVDKQERNFIEAFRREYVAVDENRNLKHHGTEQIALAAFRAWKASAPSSCAATDPLLPGLLEAERILRMIGYDEEDFAMQRLLAHIAPRRVTADQMAAMSAVSATEGSKP